MPPTARHSEVMDELYHCPVEVAMVILGGRWSPVILAHLKESPRRYSELKRLIPDISEKMLTQRLREFQSEGIVERSVDGANAFYDLTGAGRTLAPVLQAMYDWGESWADAHHLTIEARSVEP